MTSPNFSAVRPKRAAEDFARNHDPAGDESSTKKPRFDTRNPSTLAPDGDDEDDPVLNADTIGNGQNRGLKRNALNLDGYESDSSNEGYDGLADLNAKARKAAKDNGDDDMFAESDKDEEKEDEFLGKKKKKPVRFLESHEIEGQEEMSKSGGHVASGFLGGTQGETRDIDSSSDSGDDEERDRIDSDMDEELGAGGKKRHAPKLDAFNMKAELEDGRFDEAGNYVRKAYDPNAAQDTWLDGVSKRDIKRAKAAQEKQEAERRERQRERDRAVDSTPLSEVLHTMILHMEDQENVTEALARHYKTVSQKKPKSYNKYKQGQPTEVEEDPAKVAAAAKAKEAIDALVECASQMANKGIDNAYDLDRAVLIRYYRRETDKDWKHPDGSQWEFHWLAADEDDIHGPYDTMTLKAWLESGQFKAGAEFRRVGEIGFSPEVEFLDRDYPDK